MTRPAMVTLRPDQSIASDHDRVRRRDHAEQASKDTSTRARFRRRGNGPTYLGTIDLSTSIVSEGSASGPALGSSARSTPRSPHIRLGRGHRRGRRRSCAGARRAHLRYMLVLLCFAVRAAVDGWEGRAAR